MVENGNKAIELYKELFGAKVVDHQPFSKEVGAQMGWSDDFDFENSTMHAELDIDGATVMLSDNPDISPMGEVKAFNNVYVLVTVDSKERIDKINETVLEKKFTVTMPLEKTFWGSWFLVFQDSFGIGWQIAYAEEP